jgi:uncharacterized protein (TIGR02099 family)
VPPDQRPVPPAAAAHSGERLQAIEHAVEGALEHALEATERTLAQRFGAGCARGLRGALRLLGWALLVAYFAFGALLLTTRYAVMPRIDQLRPWLEQQASRVLGAQLSIGRIEAGWRGVNPRLTLRDVRLTGRGGEARLALPQVDAEVSWSSVPRLTLHFASLSIVAPELEVRRLAPARFAVAGFIIEPQAHAPTEDSPLLDWLLAQDRIGIRDAHIDYIDEMRATAGADAPRYRFSEVRLTLLGGWVSNRVSLQAQPPPEIASAIDLRGEFRRSLFKPASDFAEWRGRVYVQLDSADLARAEAVARVLPAGMAIEHAQGAVRAWATLDRAALTRFTADVALSDVRAVAGADLAPLEVTALRGRFTQLEWGNAFRGGQELQLQGFTLQGAGLALPPTDLRYRYTRGSDASVESGGEPPRLPRVEFEASLLSLDTLTQLAAHIPLARDLRQLVARQDLRGRLTNVKLDLDGALDAPDRFVLRTRFDGLSMAAQPADPPRDAAGHPHPGLPGFANLSGSIEVTDTGGTLELNARDAVTEFPGVFEQPRLGFERLVAQLRWTKRGTQLDVQLQNLAASNADLDLTASGGYQRSTESGSGPGTIDLTAHINRVEVAAAARYAPLVAGPKTRAWLAQALTGGRGTDGNVRLRGDLYEFPFRDPRHGEFRASVRVRDGRLDYLPGGRADDGSTWPAWPRLEAIDADVVFERQTMMVSARSATIFNTRVQNAVARVADFRGDALLSVRGFTTGPAADMLRYVRDSGLRDPLHFLAGASATGNARLDLSLDIPLTAGREVGVAGTITLAGNDIVLREDILPFTRTNGRIDFTRRSLTLTNISAGFAGGQLSASAVTRGDGGIVVTGSGTATPAGISRQVDIPLVQRLLARAQGSTRYSGRLTVRAEGTDLQVESDLAGWAIDAPAPLAKTATESLPVRVDLTGLGGARDQINLTAGSAITVRLERVRGAEGPRIERGVIAVGEPATLPPRGLTAHVNLPRLDVDAWQPLIEGPEAPSAPAGASARGAGAAAGTEGLPELVSLRTRELVIAGKPIANVVLGATRLSDGGEPLWVANVSSDHVNGALSWRPAMAGGSGRVSARLTRLAIPESQRTQVAQLLDAPPRDVPGVDVIADSFELGGKALGRLELVAVNGGTAAQPVWNLQKLELQTPEAKMSASGRWQREPGQSARTMALTFGLDFSNAGELLARLGIPDALRGGQGHLEGDLSWRGSPFAIHYPTLSGQLKLNTSKGQFLKASAGAGRLLGVLSLQSLPRRITLDFRDVFSEGFAFDSVTATAQLKAGVLSTRDFRMRGASANVLIEGSTDVGRETQDLRVLVLPEINAGSASLAYALLANPAIGLGTFLAQLLLRDPLAKAFSFEYDITGTWSDPQVKRRERTSPEAKDGQAEPR